MNVNINLLDILLKSYELERSIFNKLIEELEKDPIGYIVSEVDPQRSKTKNIVKSILQILLPFRKYNYIVNKKVFKYINMVFLGVSAGGFAVIQGCRTGGFIINVNDKRIHVDPGVSAVRDCIDYMHCSGEVYHPVLTDIILATHHHIDHSGGLEEYVECWLPFSKVLKKYVIGNETVIHGNLKFDQGPRQDKYKKSKIFTYSVKPRDILKFDDITIRATEARHIEAYDPITKDFDGYCVGFVIETPYGTIGVTGDTEYYEGIEEEFSDVDYLVAYIVQERARASGEPERYNKNELYIKKSLHTQFLGEIGVELLLKDLKPKCCIITHYGDQLASIVNGRIVYKDIPEVIAKRIEHNTGIRTIPALEGMMLSFKKDIEIQVYENYLFKCR